VLPEPEGGAQVLLRGLPQIQPMVSEHAVQSLDWYHPLAADLPTRHRYRRLLLTDAWN
jgi:pyruvate,water dikinase